MIVGEIVGNNVGNTVRNNFRYGRENSIHFKYKLGIKLIGFDDDLQEDFLMQI